MSNRTRIFNWISQFWCVRVKISNMRKTSHRGFGFILLTADRLKTLLWDLISNSHVKSDNFLKKVWTSEKKPKNRNFSYFMNSNTLRNNNFQIYFFTFENSKLLTIRHSESEIQWRRHMKMACTIECLSRCQRTSSYVIRVCFFLLQRLVEMSNVYDSFEIVALLSRLVLFDEKVHTTNEWKYASKS